MGFLQNARSYVSGRSPGDFIPDWFLEITVRQVPRAFGQGTADEQVTASIILMGWSIASSVVTLGLTLVLVAVFALTLIWGILRWSDWFNNRYESARSRLGPGRGKNGSYRIRRGGN